MEQAPKKVKQAYTTVDQVPKKSYEELEKLQFVKGTAKLADVLVDDELLPVEAIQHGDRIIEVMIGDSYSYLAKNFAGLSCEQQVDLAEEYSCGTLDDKLSEMTFTCECDIPCDLCASASDSE